MSAYADETRNEKTISGTLALAMHALFFALLVFGVAWQKRESPPMMAELWSELPAPKVAPPPPVEPKPVPKIQPKPAPKPVPRVEPKPEPKPVPKADIELREKKEKERKAREKELAEKKKREELARQEALKKEQAKLEALKRQQEKERAEQLAREQDEALRKIAQAEAQARLVDEYKRRIQEKIRRFVVEPPNLPRTAQVDFDVVLLPGGEVLGVKLRKSSGLPAYDSAVERAILRAQPLPLPPDPTMFKEFRELNLIFRPKE
ncbi:MAG TPA: TonB C-terminal domain-containing protein [Burkholderiales bacterium]|nr:TonB C-terminal domain-containing protein [Burkholderiales bacterium]